MQRRAVRRIREPMASSSLADRPFTCIGRHLLSDWLAGARREGALRRSANNPSRTGRRRLFAQSCAP